MRALVVLPVVLAACAASPPAPRRPNATAASDVAEAAAPVPTGCPARIDVAFANALLARHAQRFGTMTAVAASVPVTLGGTVTDEGRAGTLERNLTADAERSQTSLAGSHAASGTDADGAWTLEGSTSVVERLTAVEGTGEALAAWLLRRAYTATFGGPPDASTRKDAVVLIAFARPELGSPTLTFDRETAALDRQERLRQLHEGRGAALDAAAHPRKQDRRGRHGGGDARRVPGRHRQQWRPRSARVVDARARSAGRAASRDGAG